MPLPPTIPSVVTGRQETLLSDFYLKAVGNKIYTFG